MFRSVVVSHGGYPVKFSILAAAFAALMSLGTAAQASTLVGQTVDCTVVNLSCTPTSFVIDADGSTPDAVVATLTSITGGIDVTFADTNVTMVYTGGPGIDFFTPRVVTFSGLTSAFGDLTGISNLSVTGVPSLEAGDFTVSGDSLRIDLAFTQWRRGTSLVTFTIDLPPAVIPLPASGLLLIAGVAGLGLARRKHVRGA